MQATVSDDPQAPRNLSIYLSDKFYLAYLYVKLCLFTCLYICHSVCESIYLPLSPSIFICVSFICISICYYIGLKLHLVTTNYSKTLVSVSSSYQFLLKVLSLIIFNNLQHIVENITFALKENLQFVVFGKWNDIYSTSLIIISNLGKLSDVKMLGLYTSCLWLSCLFYSRTSIWTLANVWVFVCII